MNKRSLAIPGTLLISAISVMDDVRRTVSMYAKRPGDLVYVVGRTYRELGGSHYYALHGQTGATVPVLRPKLARGVFQALARVTAAGLAEAVHDCSEGGIGVAAAEMAFAGGLGMDLFLAEAPRDKAAAMETAGVLFSQSNSRFIVEVAPKNKARFEAAMAGVPFGLAGCVSRERTFRVYGLDARVCVEAGVGELKESWQKTLRW